MKYFIMALILIPVIGFSKEISLSEFNSKLQHNFNDVLESNPQLYEKKSYGRMPASVIQEGSENLTEKLDHFEEQVDGQKSW